MLCSVFLPSSKPLNLPTFPNSFQELINTVKAQTKGAPVNISLKYMDSENDLINLQSEDDFQIAVTTCQKEQENVLKVFVAYHSDAQKPTLKYSSSLGFTQTLSPVSAPKNSKVRVVPPLQFSNMTKSCPLPGAMGISNDLAAKSKEMLKGNVKGFFSGLSGRSQASCDSARIVSSRGKYSGKVLSHMMEDEPLKVQSEEEFRVLMTIENTGAEPWPNDVKLCCINGIYRGREEPLLSLGPQGTQKIEVILHAPASLNKYLCQWRLQFTEEGQTMTFGESFFMQILVEEKKNKIIKLKSLENYKSPRLSSNLIRRAKTLTEAYFNEVKEKKQGDQTSKDEVAQWFNKVFPGNLQDKVEFLDNYLYNGNEEEIPKVIEMYLLKLSDAQIDCKDEKEEASSKKSQEILVSLF